MNITSIMIEYPYGNYDRITSIIQISMIVLLQTTKERRENLHM